MKQGMRLFTKPGTFMNQLQWSPNHWYFVTLFMLVATVETYTGNYQAVYNAYALELQRSLGLGSDLSLFAVVLIRLLAMLAGAFAVSYFVWFVGSLFGRQTSRRVLLRRMISALTFFLAGYTCSHLASEDLLALVWVGYALYAWGAVLGYFSLREHFALSTLEAAVLGVFALFIVVAGWHYSGDIAQAVTKRSISIQSVHKGPAQSSKSITLRVR